MGRMEGIRGKVGVVTVGLLLLTAVVSVIPGVQFAYRAPAAAVGVSTANGLIAGLAAYLVFGRYRRTFTSSDLLLLLALLLLAFTSLVLSALPRAIPSLQTQPFALWAPAIGRMLGAGALLAAAGVSGQRLKRPLRGVLVTGGTALLAVAAVAAIVGALSSRLPVGEDIGVSLAELGQPAIVGPLPLLALQIATIVLYVVATIRFMKRFESFGDELIKWFALATPFAAFAALHQLLFPSVFPDHIYTADLLRLGFSVVLLRGALQEIHGYWQASALNRVLEERRRIARDLHDGLAQELAFIVTKTAAIEHDTEHDPNIRQIGAAADRALGESRRAIAALTHPVDEPLDIGLAQIAEELTDRAGTRLELELAADVRVSPDTRETLLRIAREAITNATRHARAEVIRVHLSDGEALRLRVGDDGIGFDPSSAGGDGGSFGLISMRERAETIGAMFRVSSSPEAGTEVEVLLTSRNR